MSVAVSIIMPNMNQKLYIREALDSICAQTWQSWEVIIIDGGSTDGSLEIAQEYAVQDERIHVFCKKGLKVSASLNFGIEQSRGKYLCYFHSDDVMYPFNLERKLDVLNRDPELVYVYSIVYRIDGDGDILDVHHYSPRANPFLQQFTNTSFIHCSSVLFKKDIVADIGEFREDLFYINDHEFWLRVARRYPGKYLQVVMTKSRAHAGTLTSRLCEEAKRAEKDRVCIEYLQNTAKELFYEYSDDADMRKKEALRAIFQYLFKEECYGSCRELLNGHMQKLFLADECDFYQKILALKAGEIVTFLLPRPIELVVPLTLQDIMWLRNQKIKKMKHGCFTVVENMPDYDTLIIVGSARMQVVRKLIADLSVLLPDMALSVLVKDVLEEKAVFAGHNEVNILTFEGERISVATTSGLLVPYAGDKSLFIYPCANQDACGYQNVEDAIRAVHGGDAIVCYDDGHADFF